MSHVTYQAIPAQHGYMLVEPLHEDDDTIALDHLPVLAWIVCISPGEHGGEAYAHTTAVTASKIAGTDDTQIIKTPYGTWSECEVAEYTTEEAVLKRLREIDVQERERAVRRSQRKEAP